MRKRNLFMLFTSLSLAAISFGQASNYSLYDYTNPQIGCMNGLYVAGVVGVNPETGGVITVDWGDGTTDTYNFTTDTIYYGNFFSHGYSLSGTYTASVNVYSATAGGNVDAGQTITLTAATPANCGLIYITTLQPSPYISFQNAPYDFTGADGITTTIVPGTNLWNIYTGLNTVNAPYTVSINDAWLVANNLVQVDPDIVITSFEPSGLANPVEAVMNVACSGSGNPDFGISYATAWNLVAPLQTGHVYLSVCNYSCNNTSDAHISIEFPAGFVPDMSTLTNASFAGNILIFDIPTLQDCIATAIPFSFPGTVEAGTLVNFTATVSHPDDSNPSNNTEPFIGIVLNSYDPNMKEVNKPTHIDPNVQEELQYVIHFQNDGNFDAMDVVVTDIIDTDLDLASFQVLGSKHAVAASIDPATRKVTFSFNDINLAPSADDLEESQGYVVYSIKENPGLAVGTEIENTANIYFDFNPAIVTNTTYNINQALAVDKQILETISMFPNPATSTIRFNGAMVNAAIVYDMAGKQLISATNVLNNELSVAELANGIYQVTIITAKGVQTQKLVIRK